MADLAAAAATMHFDILETIRTAQMQNGLRHGDYSRYKQYCARRLRRLRTGKGVDWKHGNGKKFVPRVMKPDNVTDPRHLAIILFNAERAWADAQETKQAAGAGENIGAVARAHMLGRFKKAASWAENLESLAKVKGDAATSLEAEAYACQHAGALAVEMELWDESLRQFGTARTIYEQLASVSSKRGRELYTERVTELAPLERFCKYNLSKADPKLAEKVAAEAVKRLPSLQPRLAETQRASLSARFDGVRTVYWKGSIVPVHSDKVRGALAEAKGAMTDAGQAAGELARKYLDEASKAASADAVSAAREGKDGAAADSRALGEYARFMKARLAVAQAEKKAAAAVAAAGEGPSSAGAKTGKKGKGSKSGGAGGQPGVSPSPSPSASTPIHMESAWAESPYHMALDKAGMASSGKDAGSSGASAACIVAFSAALQGLDDMAVLLGGPLAPHHQGAGVGTEAVLSALPQPPADADVESLRCLFARQAAVLAWRCWHVALTYSSQNRYADAATMLSRTQARVAAARSAYAALTSTGKEYLPAHPVLPGSPESERADLPLSFVLTGVCADEATVGLDQLSTLVAARAVAIETAALVESLGPSLRGDAPVAPLYKAAMAAPGLVRATEAEQVALKPLVRSTERPAWLTARADESALLEPTQTPLAIGPFPPASLPVPAKPFLFDLAFNGVAYPYAVTAAADAIIADREAKAAKQGAGGKSEGGGVLSWLTGR